MESARSLLMARFVSKLDERMRTMYELTMKEWRGCEAIVRQREREKHAEALARCSSGASVERGPIERDSTISTDASLTPFFYFFFYHRLSQQGSL